MSVQSYLRDKMLGWKLHRPQGRREFYGKSFITETLQNGIKFAQEVVAITERHKIEENVVFSVNNLEILVILNSPDGQAMPERYKEIVKEINDIAPRYEQQLTPKTLDI